MNFKKNRKIFVNVFFVFIVNVLFVLGLGVLSGMEHAGFSVGAIALAIAPFVASIAWILAARVAARA